MFMLFLMKDRSFKLLHRCPVWIIYEMSVCCALPNCNVLCEVSDKWPLTSPVHVCCDWLYQFQSLSAVFERTVGCPGTGCGLRHEVPAQLLSDAPRHDDSLRLTASSADGETAGRWEAGKGTSAGSYLQTWGCGMSRDVRPRAWLLRYFEGTPHPHLPDTDTTPAFYVVTVCWCRHMTMYASLPCQN